MGSDDIKNKYFVNGLYPDCDSTREECLNFNIVYSSGAPANLEGLREELPVENIFPEDQIPDQNTAEGLADLNKYKNSLYYFRRFKNSDGNNEIEAQIRCDIDPTSDFHCSFIRGQGPITWILGEQGDNCTSVCARIGSTCTVPDIDSEAELQAKMGEFGHGDCTPGVSAFSVRSMGPTSAHMVANPR